MKKFLASSLLIIVLFTGCATTDPIWTCVQTCFSTVPIPPIPTPQPIPDPPDPGIPEYIVVADLNTIPDRMTAAGFPGSENAQYYVLAHVAAFGPGASIPDHPELTVLSGQRAGIEVWWDAYMAAIRAKMKANSLATAIVIVNDGPDRCGFRLGPPTMSQLSEFGDRVQLGTIVPESEY